MSLYQPLFRSATRFEIESQEGKAIHFVDTKLSLPQEEPTSEMIAIVTWLYRPDKKEIA